jgi:hypothetical protein
VDEGRSRGREEGFRGRLGRKSEGKGRKFNTSDWTGG